MSLLRLLILVFSLSTIPFLAFAEEAKSQEETRLPSSFVESMKKSNKEESIPGVGRIVFSLFLVVIIAFFIVFVLKKVGYRGDKVFVDTALIKVVASKKLSVKSTMHLVDVDSVQYIVVEKESAVSIVPHSIADIPDKMS